MTALEVRAREDEIKARAKKVYDISFDYHLTHAVFGSDRLLVSDLVEGNKEKTAKLKNDLVAAYREKNTDKVNELMGNIKTLERTLKARKHHILIDYIKMDDAEGGRVIKANNTLVITLPRKLTESIMDDQGNLKAENIENVRKIMAHELGHIVLHTDLLPEDNLAGSGVAGMSDVDWEAKVFADELLRLYKERDHRINYND